MRMRRATLSRLQGYVIAVLASALALLSTELLQRVLQLSPFTLFFGAVILTAWYAGLGPALLAIALSALASQHSYLTPVYTAAFDPDNTQRLAVFVVVGLLVSFLARSRTRAEARFRVTLSSIGDAVIVTDRQGRVSFMNGVAQSLTGWEQREALGKPLPEVFKIVNEQSRKPVENPVTKVLRHGTVVGLANHTLLVAKDGAERPIDDSGAPVRDDRGDITGVVLVFRDVSERRQAEQVSSQLAAIVESAEDAIIGKTLDGVITSWNHGAELLYGYSAEEVRGRPITLLAPPDRRDEIPQILERLKRGERIERLETVRVSEDGKLIDVSLTISPIKDGAGTITGASTIARDITGRKEADKERESLLERDRAAQEQVRNILESISDGFYALDRQWRYTYVNQRAARLARRPREELIGSNIWETFPHAVGQKDYGELQRAAAEQVPAHFENYYAPFDLWYETEAYPSPNGLSVFVRDVTERKRAEEQLRASLREKEVLLKEIHHRVKNNLQVISSLLSLKAGTIKDRETLQIFKECQSRVRSMALLHEKLYQSGDLASIDFSAYVRELAATLFGSYGVEPGNISLEVCAPGILLGIDSAVPCGLIVNELVSNCLKHAFPGGRPGEIRIELVRRDDNNLNKLVLRVSDNGVGLPEDIDFENLGSLGLRIVRTLTEQLNGALEFDNSGGTQFTISFTG
jgi:PAS domain S-box-containing protein